MGKSSQGMEVVDCISNINQSSFMIFIVQFLLIQNFIQKSLEKRVSFCCRFGTYLNNQMLLLVIHTLVSIAEKNT